MLVRATISGGNTELLVISPIEDLKHDFSFFIERARKVSADDKKTMFLHQRWLRAALFALLAYIEAEVNRFVYRALEDRKVDFLFERIERDSLDRKVELLHKLMPSTTSKFDIQTAKHIRNLWIHSKPGNEEKAFEGLTLAVVEQAEQNIDAWISETEKRLGIDRHQSSSKVSRSFTRALGKVTESAGSNRRYFKSSKRKD